MNSHDHDERRLEIQAARPDFPMLETTQAMQKALQLIDDNLGNQQFNVLNLSRIKVPAGGGTEFRVETASGVENHRTLVGVVTAFRQARVYWEAPFGSKRGKQPPDCTSADGFVGVGRPGGSCPECPFAQFKTARNPNGTMGAGQACKELRQLLLLLPGQMLPHMLNVPPTSLASWNKYSLNLIYTGASYWGVTTKLTLEPATSGGGIDFARISFSLYTKLGRDQIATLEPYHDRMRAFLTPLTVDATAYEIIEPAPAAGLPAPEATEEEGEDQVPF